MPRATGRLTHPPVILTYMDVLMSREAGKDCSYNPIAFPPSLEVRCRERPAERSESRDLLQDVVEFLFSDTVALGGPQ